MTTQTPKIQPEYEALGIHPDTMTCIAVMPEKDAREYVWALATQGIACEARRDPRKDHGKHRWHVAVVGGLAYNPAAYFASIRGPKAVDCTAANPDTQHPTAVEED